MASSNGQRTLRLIVIDSDKNARAYLRHALGAKGVRVIGEADDVKSGLRLIRGLQPDLILLELPASASPTIEAVKKIKEELPDTGIILSSHESSPQLILSCIRAGAQEFVSRPIDGPELEKAVDHVRKLLERMITTDKKRGKVLSVFSSKGGIGVTSVVANLGVALAGHVAAKTVVVDLSFQMGDLGLMFDRPPRYSLPDAFDKGTLDETKLQSVLASHESGAYVLTVAASPEIGEEITRNHMVQLFGALTTMFDYVVVDIGRNLDDRTVEVLDLSDGVLLVSTMDIPTIRNVSRYLSIFTELRLDKEKIKLIVNRYQKKSRLTLNDLEAALGMEAYWTIPNAFEPMSRGIDGGNPAVVEAPKSKVAQSFRDLAESLCSPNGAHSASERIETTTN